MSRRQQRAAEAAARQQAATPIAIESTPTSNESPVEAAFVADAVAGGRETGHIIVDGKPMAYWLPTGVTAADIGLGGTNG